MLENAETLAELDGGSAAVRGSDFALPAGGARSYKDGADREANRWE